MIRKPYGVRMKWGRDESQRKTYRFATEAEREAFLLGASEAEGWMTYSAQRVKFKLGTKGWLRELQNRKPYVDTVTSCLIDLEVGEEPWEESRSTNWIRISPTEWKWAYHNDAGELVSTGVKTAEELLDGAGCRHYHGRGDLCTECDPASYE